MLIQTFVMFALVLGACYWFTKKFAKASMKANKSKYMEILDRMALGQDKFIGIVRVGTRYFFISVTSGEIRVLGELDEEDLTETKVAEDGFRTTGDFKKLLEKFKMPKQEDGRQNG